LDFQLAYPLDQIPYVLVALILAFTIHEFAHAFVAYRFGDPTAHQQGRVTLNPLAHLDPIGTLLIFLIGFGWARPVPVNRFYFKNPRLAGVLTTLAGPLSNLILAFLFTFVWVFYQGFGVHDLLSSNLSQIIESLLWVIVKLNVVLFVFNLLPLPPLDGYRIIEDLVSNDARAKMSQYENYGVFIFLLLAITPLGDYIFNPLFNVLVPAIIQGMVLMLSPLW
jgi:Zn-dependent protease